MYFAIVGGWHSALSPVGGVMTLAQTPLSARERNGEMERAERRGKSRNWEDFLHWI